MKTNLKMLSCFILVIGMSSAQAQIGKMKSLGKSAIPEKKSTETKEAAPAEKSAKPAETAPAKEKAPVVLGKFNDTQAGMKDAGLEKQAVDVVMEKATREHWNEKYSKAIIVSKDWEITKNELTGAVVNRKLSAVLYGSWPDGKCKSVGFSFLQDYDGKKFQNTLQYVGIGDMKQVECEK